MLVLGMAPILRPALGPTGNDKRRDAPRKRTV